MNDLFFIECGLLFRNFQLIDLLYLITSFKSFIGGCETLASGHARSACVGGACVEGGWKHALGMRVGWRAVGKHALGIRVGWHARSACVGMRVGKHAFVGTREARALGGGW
jgi:hypothetical protein